MIEKDVDLEEALWWFEGERKKSLQRFKKKFPEGDAYEFCMIQMTALCVASFLDILSDVKTGMGAHLLINMRAETMKECVEFAKKRITGSFDDLPDFFSSPAS